MVSAIMHDVSTNSTQRNICQLFIHSSDVHIHVVHVSLWPRIFIVRNLDSEENLNLSLGFVQGCETVYTPTGVD